MIVSEEDLNALVHAGMKRLLKRPDLAPDLRDAITYAVSQYKFELTRDYAAKQARGDDARGPAHDVR